MTRAHWEYLIGTVIATALFTFLVPALLNARAAVRDDLRKTDIANLKHALEMYYNAHNAYPLAERGCSLFTGDSQILKEKFIDAIPHDVRESRGHMYKYCVTDGYFLEAQLETAQPETIDHDDDEKRNYNYRVLHEDGKILYRVCGGEEKQCDIS